MLFDVPIYVIAASALVVGSFPVLAYSLAGIRKRTPLPETAAELPIDQRQALLRTGPLDRVILPTIRFLGRGVRRISPAGWVEALNRRIRIAGSPALWTLERALAMKMVLGIGGLISGLQWTGGLFGSVLTTVLAGAFGYGLPDLLLWSRGKERQGLIQKELPDTMDQLTISVEAGLGFDAALARVASTGQGPLAEELRRLIGEVKVGVPRREALRHLLDRTDVQELRHFVLALQQAEEYGLPVARVLRVQSTELRVKRRQRAEEQAMKIPVKIVFPLVLCIFPALFVVLLGPAMIRVMRTLF